MICTLKMGLDPALSVAGTRAGKTEVNKLLFVKIESFATWH